MTQPKRTNWRSTLLVALVAFSLAVGATTALAATSSVRNVGTFAGHTYTNQALTQNVGTTNIRSFTYVKLTAGGPAPANYYGGQPRTYAGGTLCASGPMSYAGAGVGTITPSVDGICDPGIGHHGLGRSTHYDGSAYLTYNTYTTSPLVYP